MFRINVSLATIILIAVAIFILRPFNCDSSPSSFDWTKIHNWLKSASYTQATVTDDVKPDSIPPDVKPAVITTVTGSGNWIPADPIAAGDTLEVDLSEITLGDGTHWIKVVIAGDEVKWYRVKRYHKETERRWTAFAEIANHESVIGAGIGYRLFTVAAVNVSPAISASVRGDWIAAELRLSRQLFSGVAAGIGGGYRSDDRVHLSAGLSIEL